MALYIDHSSQIIVTKSYVNNTFTLRDFQQDIREDGRINKVSMTVHATHNRINPRKRFDE